jgi:cysteine desulfurase
MRPVYLDNNASTPAAAEVVEAMSRAARDLPANPSGVHAAGAAAREAVDLARAQVASLIGCEAADVLFTSGGTESDNIAVLGGARARVASGAARHVVTTNVEHPAVELACVVLEREGFEVTRVPVDASGCCDAAAVAEAIRADTALVTVMHAQNETGAIMPVKAIAGAAGTVPVHTDAAQSVGKIPVKVDDLGVHLLTVVGHKFYGPRGVGALYRRPGTPLEPVLVGGGHEGGLRPGTENVPAIVGLGRACVLAETEMDERVRHARHLRARLEERLRASIPDLAAHGDPERRLPNTLFASIPGVDANALLRDIGSEVAASAGSACHSGETAPPQVLLAMGVAPDLASCAVRLSVGRDNDEDEIDRAAARIVETAGRLRG